MVDTIFIGYINLKKYPKFELFEYFSERIGSDENQELNELISHKIKVQFIKFIIHMIVASLIGSGLFILGFYLYQRILIFSIVISLFFVGVFMYVSKAREIKLIYFNEFSEVIYEFV